MPLSSPSDRLRPVITDREVVDLAESYHRAHGGAPVRVSQLSRALGISERALRNAFHRVHGMAPHRCLRAVRLESVHRTLCAAGDRTMTVTTVAADHGFFELGRFAAHYRDAFGEPPSATLRRQRAQQHVRQ